MTLARRLADAAARSIAILGAPGLIVGLISLVSFAFGVLVLAIEYDRPRRSGQEAASRSIEGWVRAMPVDEVGRALSDYADAWRADPTPVRRERLRNALESLGVILDRQDSRLTLLNIESMRLRPRGGAVVVSWTSHRLLSAGPPAVEHRIELLDARRAGTESKPPIDLSVRYRVGPIVDRAVTELETSYRRLLLAVLGLSGYSLLCLGAMVIQARNLRDRASLESAQRATLDLADRTCHELGNVVFVLANERRNLAEHLDLIDRFLDARAGALSAACRDAGLDPGQASRLRRAFDRRFADLGLDPEVELRTGSTIARDVCRQVEVCAEYIALTVRELDGYLKQSSLPVEPAPVRLGDAIDEALTLLGPRLESASAIVDRPRAEEEARVALADRRLLVHALVNLLKNALEATTSAGISPRIGMSIEAAGSVVRLGVSDNGPGVPESVRSRLFEPGYSTKGPGRGRGLAIARDSIRAQGGTLSIADGSGPGASFRIELPLVPSLSETQSDGSDRNHPGSR